MPNPKVFTNDFPGQGVRSPYDVGLSYFPDEFSQGDGDNGDASRLGWVQFIPVAVETVQKLEASLSSADKTRLARANSIRDLAIQGSVLAAQIVLAGPANVSGNEAKFWTDAAAQIQSQRPDVWSEAQAAGAWWPVGADFDMTDARRRIAQDLSSAGVALANVQQVGASIGSGVGSTSAAARAAGKSGVAMLLANPLIVAAALGGAVLLVSKRKRGR